MSELDTYSIETDQTVLLTFKDGQKIRVAVGELASHLGPADVQKITRALQLRRDFIRRHMPKAVIALAAGGAMALLAFTGTKIAAWVSQRPVVTPSPDVETPAVVRSLLKPTPRLVAATPTPVLKDSEIARLPLPSPQFSPQPSIAPVITISTPPENIAATTIKATLKATLPNLQVGVQVPATAGIKAATQPAKISPLATPTPDMLPSEASTPPDILPLVDDTSGRTPNATSL